MAVWCRVFCLDQPLAKGYAGFGAGGHLGVSALSRAGESAHSDSYTLKYIRIVTICYQPRAFVVCRIVCLDLDVDVHRRVRAPNPTLNLGASQRRTFHGKVYLRDTVTNAARCRAQRTFSERKHHKQRRRRACDEKC